MNIDQRTEEIPPWNVNSNTDIFRIGLTQESHGGSAGNQSTPGAPMFLKSGLADQSNRPVLEGDSYTESHQV